MGTYVDIEDIESEFRQMDFGASGALVADAEVTEFITQAESYVESRISCKYAVPITGTAPKSIIKTICTYLVADRISKIIKVKTNTATDQDTGNSLSEVAEEMLKQICEEDLKLIGETLQESGNGIKSWSSANSSTFDRTFKRASDQW